MLARVNALAAITLARGTGAAMRIRAALTTGFFSAATAALRARRG
jgi:hypothetical protein